VRRPAHRARTSTRVTPLLHRADLSTGQLSLVALAMGAGALALSHINDAEYWTFTKLTGLDVAAACARGRT
jgi:GntP family gluconate:H+ symporter